MNISPYLISEDGSRKVIEEGLGGYVLIKNGLTFHAGPYKVHVSKDSALRFIADGTVPKLKNRKANWK